MGDREVAIEAIVAEMRKPGYAEILVVSPSLFASVVIQEEVRKAFALTLLDYEEKDNRIYVGGWCSGLRSVWFQTDGNPTHVMGLHKVSLIVVEKTPVDVDVLKVLDGLVRDGACLVFIS